MGNLEKLREREAKLKRRIREVQSRANSDKRKERNARLIRWGVVVEALLKTGEIETNEWIGVCRKILKNDREFDLATSNLISSLPNEAHLNVSQPADEKQCAPAVS